MWVTLSRQTDAGLNQSTVQPRTPTLSPLPILDTWLRNGTSLDKRAVLMIIKRRLV